MRNTPPEPTRDDLRVWRGPLDYLAEPTYEEVTPDEFDRIARSEGYVRLDDQTVREMRSLLDAIDTSGIYHEREAQFYLRKVLAALGEEE